MLSGTLGRGGGGGRDVIGEFWGCERRGSGKRARAEERTLEVG